MSVRFRPPPLAGFYAGEGADQAAALVAAREEGFAEGRALGAREGHAAGLREGEAQTRDAIRPQLDALHESTAKQHQYNEVGKIVRELLDRREEDNAALERTVREIAAASLRTLFPVLLSRAAGAEIAALLAAALTEREPETLTLRAHPDTLALVADETASVDQAGRLVLSAEPRRAPGSAEIEWSGGGMSFDPDALLTRVTEVLTHIPPPPDPLPEPPEPHADAAETVSPSPDTPEPQKALS